MLCICCIINSSTFFQLCFKYSQSSLCSTFVLDSQLAKFVELQIKSSLSERRSIFLCFPAVETLPCFSCFSVFWVLMSCWLRQIICSGLALCLTHSSKSSCRFELVLQYMFSLEVFNLNYVITMLQLGP